MDADYANFMEKAEPGIINQKENTQLNFDPKQMDRLDYMISRFKEHGIYVDINLHVARKYDMRDGFSGIDQRPTLDKGFDNFEKYRIKDQKEYAKKLLTHINSYTGLSYTNDPCVALVEINNEKSLLTRYRRGSIDKLPNPYALEFKKLWNEWLHKKYTSTEKICQAWDKNKTKLGGSLEKRSIPTMQKKDESETNKKEVHDFYQFMIDTEQSYWMGMYNYLKKDLKLKSVVSGTQVYYTSPYLMAQFDYVDSHSYWHHPSPVNPEWKIQNESMINSLSTIQRLASQRIYNKPFTISEYNHPFPNQYGAEGQPLLRAYGRLQGWSGVFEYTYNHRLNFEPQNIPYFFDMLSRTDVMAHMPACAAIFLRGDVHEAKHSIIAGANKSDYLNRLASTGNLDFQIKDLGLDSRLTLLHKTAIDLTGKSGNGDIKTTDTIPADKKIFVSDTGELTWNIEEPGAGYWTVNTTDTKLFTGFPKGRKITMGEVSLSVGRTRLNWATISLVSKNATGFGESGKPADILLTATGLVENKGMVMEKFPENKIKLTKWGEGPVMAEGIPAEILLPSDSEKTKCYVLNPHGDREIEVPVEKAEKGGSKIIIKPEYKTVWYEIEIQ